MSNAAGGGGRFRRRQGEHSNSTGAHLIQPPSAPEHETPSPSTGMPRGYSAQAGHYGSDSVQQYSRSSYSHNNAGMKQSRRRRRQRIALVLSIVAVACVLVWLGWLLHTMPATLTVNGTRVSVPYTSTYADLHDMGYLLEDNGDYVAVDGTVLTPGAGEPYKVLVNGTAIADNNTRVKRGATVTEERGENIMEDYSTTESTVARTWDISGSHADGALGITLTQGHDGIQRLRTGLTSGVQAIGDDSVSMVPWTARWYNVSPPADKKVIALTFDDGPSPEYTQKVLDLLNQYGAVATFFQEGQYVEKYPDLSRAVVEQGSQVASHTYDHPYYLNTISADQVRDELQKTQQAIQNATGVTTTTVRAPDGEFGADTWLEAGDLVTVDVYWNVDSGDWSSTADAASIENAVISGARSGRIVIMHDGVGKHDATIEALGQILPKLQADGYTFATIDQLVEMERDALQSQGVINEDGELVQS